MPQTKELAPPVDFAAPAKVLVVDDQMNMRTTTAMVLRAAGHQVAEAEDGSAAVQRLGGESFDVVLTDLRMGAVDGLEVLRSALETSPSTQVIVMTAFGTIESAVEAIRRGAYDYLPKPFKESELLLRVEKAVERRRLLGEVSLLAGDFRARYGGTTGIARPMTITATTNSAIVNNEEPNHMANAFIADSCLRNASTAGSDGRPPIGQHQHRGAHGDDIERVRARHVGRRKLSVPGRATVRDPRGAVGIPALDVDHLPDVERRLRRRRRVREAPAERGDRQRYAQHPRHPELHRHARPQPGGHAAQRDRDADGEQVERPGHQLGQVKDPVLANVRGAALLASAALGYIQYDEIASRVPIERVYEPNADHRRIYDELFDEFIAIYQNNHKIHARLDRLQEH